MMTKYKAWLKEFNELREVNKIVFNQNEEQLLFPSMYETPFVGVEGWCELFTIGDDVELLQYIGRTDENEDGIYTDFIISVIDQGITAGYYYENDYIGVVKYDDDQCTYYLELIEKNFYDEIPDVVDGMPVSRYYEEEEIERYYFGEDIVPEDIQILGNIYENPELLKGEQNE